MTVIPGGVPFAAAFDREGHLAVIGGTPNAVITFAMGADRALTQLDSAPTGQAATC